MKAAAPVNTIDRREAYARIFQEERIREYPRVDAFEERCGYAIDRDSMEVVARVLACPLKVNPPNWQHGRVLYAATRKYLEAWGAPRDIAIPPVPEVRLLDIGTAKGFSAWCLQRALMDANARGAVVSLDVIDPLSTTPRNSVADCDGPHMLRELHAPWPEMWAITFLQSTGLEWLKNHAERIHVAFVDGKHEGTIVYQEGKLIADHQQPGDLAIFDDVHLPSVSQAVHILGLNYYRIEYLEVLPNRHYAVGVRL